MIGEEILKFICEKCCSKHNDEKEMIITKVKLYECIYLQVIVKSDLRKKMCNKMKLKFFLGVICSNMNEKVKKKKCKTWMLS